MFPRVPNQIACSIQMEVCKSEPKQVGPKLFSRLKKVDNTNNQRLSELPCQKAVNLEFNNLSFTIQQGICLKKKGFKTLLDNLSGQFNSKELTAIMGPSGAGKSTMMNVLAGYREKGMTGQILVNGHPRDLVKFQKMSCYIMQMDVLMPHLSTEEAMMVAAHLKLNESLQVKRKIVNEVLTALGLKSCAKTRTNNLSGGQSKRLAIGLELVNNPPVMFFDEPISGLDSATAIQVISLLKCLANGGRTIICTIHQPSGNLFQMFDKLFILSQGQCIYKGTVSHLIPHLTNLNLHCPIYHNPADFIIEVATGTHGDMQAVLFQAARSSPCCEESVEDNQGSSKNLESELMPLELSYFATSMFKQFYILFKRNLTAICRDAMLTHLRLTSHIVMGLLIGLLYLDIGNDAKFAWNNTAYLFFSMLFLMFAALMPTVLTFPLEMSVLVREHLNSWYSLHAYYLAKTCADIPLQVVTGGFHSSFYGGNQSSFPISFPDDLSNHVLRYHILDDEPAFRGRSLLAFCLLFYIGRACRSVTGAARRGSITVNSGRRLCRADHSHSHCLVLRIFCHFQKHSLLSSLDLLHLLCQVRLIGYFLLLYMCTNEEILFRYGFEGVLHSIYGLDRKNLECKEQMCNFEEPQNILQMWDVPEGIIYVDFIILGVFFTIIRVVTYVILRYRIRATR
ncbi:ATP-binding cassette sub-family G member 4-like isoform X2 [Corythoichthys intestinalis]|uniref:ATP-binding cassette sub-family G member 4-like isoform X2 n=1 Tax=Corythoichthys intestinalis TaxID=161448 RepID=UPI0025A60FA5|nr:ATP-binding cassette sub-family G member 4-like isoform X2 [Corythoichthys intestinalis]